MSTIVTLTARALTVFALLMAMVATPTLAHAAGTRTVKTNVTKLGKSEVKASKFATLSKSAKAKLARATMGGLSVAGNAAWALGTGALAIYSAAHGEPQSTAIFGGFATYNTIQAIRKWKAEKAMNE